MVLKILGGIAGVIVLIIAYAAFQPAAYEVSRSIDIQAMPEAIFPWVNNSRKSMEWMPWSAMDPKMTMTYSGPEEGVGAVSSWDSPGQMGAGSATIVESTANTSVKTKLIYTKPFKGEQDAEITIAPAGVMTKVTWTVRGENNLIGRVMCLFMNMQKMIGDSFSKGLGNLKAKAETTPVAIPVQESTTPPPVTK